MAVRYDPGRGSWACCGRVKNGRPVGRDQGGCLIRGFRVNYRGGFGVQTSMHGTHSPLHIWVFLGQPTLEQPGVVTSTFLTQRKLLA